MSKKGLLALSLFCAAAAGISAQGIGANASPDYNGKNASDSIIRVRAIGVMSEDSPSSVSQIGGHVSVTNTPAPELDLSYLFTDQYLECEVRCGLEDPILRRIDRDVP